MSDNSRMNTLPEAAPDEYPRPHALSQCRRRIGRVSAVARCVVAAGLLTLPQGCARHPNGPGHTHKLMLWHAARDTPLAYWIDRAARRLERQHRNVRVTIVATDPTSYEMKLRTAFCADALPDIFQTRGAVALTSLVQAKKLLDLSHEFARRGWRRGFRPPGLALCKVDGRHYALPVAVDGLFLWCNNRILSSLGLPAPRTLAELDSACLRLKTAGLIPVALGNSNRVAGSEWLAYLAHRVGGTPLFTPSSAQAEGQEFAAHSFVRAGGLLHRRAAEGCFGPSFASRSRAEAMGDFCSEKAAFILAGATPVAEALRAFPQLAGHVECLPFPILDGDEAHSGAVIARVNAAFAVSKNCGEPYFAMRLLRLLSSSDLGAALMRAGVISATSLPDVASVDAPLMEQAAAVFSSAGGVQRHYADCLSEQVHERHKELAHRIMTGRTSPDAAGEEMATLVRELAKK